MPSAVVKSVGSEPGKPRKARFRAPKRRDDWSERFMMVHLGGAGQIPKLRLSGRTEDVLWSLISRTEMGTNHVRMSQQAIGEIAGMPVSQVSRALLDLAEREMIVILDVSGQRAYMLNPAFAYRGHLKNIPEAQERFNKALAKASLELVSAE